MNEVFFDEVRVPAENLVGEENRGWYQMATTLDFERSGAQRFTAARRNLEDLVRYARSTRQGDKLLGSGTHKRAIVPADF